MYSLFKIKKDGFTLVELLATIVVIALISLLIIPNISGILNDTKSSSYDIQISTIEKAAQKYAVQNNIKLPDTGKKGYISVRDLMAKGELNDSQIKNPNTGVNLNGGVLIEYDSSNNQYIYTYVEDLYLDASSLLGPTYIVEREHEYTTSKNVAILYPEGYSDYEFKLLEGTIMLGDQRITGPSDWIASNTLRENLVFITNGSLTSRVGDTGEYKNGDTLVISTIDTTAPTVILGYDSEKSTTNKAYIYATCSDPESGINKYEFRLLPNGNWIDNGLNNEYIFTELTESREYSYEARCTNGSGMIGVGSFNSLVPSMETPTFIVEKPGVWQHDKDVTINYPTGYSRYEYKILDGEVTSSNGTLLPLNTWIVASGENESVNFTTNGSVVARVFDGTSYKNANQNIGYVDSVAPSVGTLTMKLVSQSGENYINDTWTNQSVYIAVNNGTDDLSGHKSTTYSINGGENLSEAITLTTTGTYNIVVTTTDNALNTSSETYIVKIDKSNPTVGFSPNGGRYNLSGTNTVSVSSKVTVSKTSSDIKVLQYAWGDSNTTAPSSWKTFTNEEDITATLGVGNHYLWINVINNAGNNVTISSESFSVIRSAAIPTNSLCVARTYTGQQQQLTSATSGTGYTLSGYNQTNAGTYTISATLSSGYNRWSDDTTGTKTFQCSISKATPVITLSATSGTVGAGSTLTFTEKANVEGTFTNTSETPSVATVSPVTNSKISPNTEKTETVTGIAAGTSAIIVSFVPTDTTNYNNATNKTYTATIVNLATIPTNSLCVARTYTGQQQQLTSVTSGTGYTLSGYNQTNAGTYTISATLSSGYKWSDNTTGTKTFNCSISKATPVITLSATSGYVGSSGVSFTEKASVAGKFTNTSSNTSTLTTSASTSEIAANTDTTVTLTGKASGSATVTVGFTPTDTTNYNNATNKTYTATVDLLPPTLAVSVANGTTAAKSHTATITITDSGGSGLSNTSVKIYYAWGT
ncbi:MAG: prepilin-type N-terminal cleavage/methylation domain-containing protein, partial [Clostridium sp.]|nr:prepilin-type N-terminal cleavage/methylation domain-containing protein [Clostridium sp.]